MSTYRVYWPCCDGVTETEAYEPEHCPFCYTPPLEKAAPDLLEALRGLDEAYCRAGSPLSKVERHEDRMRLIAARAAIAKAAGGDA